MTYGDFDAQPYWDNGNRAAAALQAYYDTLHTDGSTYGDEGSDAFSEAFIGLLIDLRFLAARAGVNYAALDRVAQEHLPKGQDSGL